MKVARARASPSFVQLCRLEATETTSEQQTVNGLRPHISGICSEAEPAPINGPGHLLKIDMQPSGGYQSNRN